MKNKLPKVFANNITKKIENNEKIYTSINKQKEIKQTTHILKEKSEKQEEKEKTKKNKQNNQQETITQKINKIMNTKEYIYKIPVKITTKSKEISTKIIGKNKKNLITINNELIKIEDIIRIEINEDDQQKK